MFQCNGAEKDLTSRSTAAGAGDWTILCRAASCQRSLFLILMIITVLFVLVRPAYAQDTELPDIEIAEAEPLPQNARIGVYVSPPFVMKEGDEYFGMGIDLWESLAKSQQITFSYTQYPSPKALIDATAQDEIDIAVSNLSITRARAQKVDFTQPWYDAGLRLMVSETAPSGIWSVFVGLADSGHLKAYGWIALVILLAAVALTLFDRKFDPDFPSKWREGFAESFYTVMSVATSGKLAGRKNLFGWAGRIWSGMWLVCGIAVLAYVTSSITSVMTTLALTNEIHNIEDIGGRTVGVLKGQTAEEYAIAEGLSERPYATLEEAVEALHKNEIIAIIGDAPVLEYFQEKHEADELDVVGPIFAPEKYGFAMPRQSPFTKRITVSLLGAKESGRVEELRTEYFGAK